MNTIYIWTEDGLRLQGIHYEPETRDLCVLVVHGMSGNIMEDYLLDILGKKLSENNIGCVYGHNRGHGHINNIEKKDGGSERFGATYEIFADSVYDINAWVSEVRSLGYKRIVLLGHSLGCNKTIHFFSVKRPLGVVGVVLASPPDMVGLFEKPGSQPNHKELKNEAKRNVAEGNPLKLVSGLLWDWNTLSSQTYLDLSQKGGPIDNLPVLRNPEVFDELAQINVPILGVMGEKDDIAIKTLEEDLELIKEKATACPSFTKVFIEGGDHTYNKREDVFADTVLNWIKSLK